MLKPQAKPATNTRAEHHTKAAECCDKAADEHRHAAKSCISGDHKMAAEHGKQAKVHGTKAQDYGRQAVAS